MNNREKLESLLKANLPGSEVKIESLVDDDNHYRVIVKSPEFAGKSKVAQHRMVIKALSGLMDKELHALSIQVEE